VLFVRQTPIHWASTPRLDGNAPTLQTPRHKVMVDNKLDALV